MARSKAPKPRAQPKLCVYCGIRAAVKNEHVFGKVFFDRLPHNMITVPACRECDSGRGDGGMRDLHLDEEYMRNVLCMRDHIADGHPVAMKLAMTKVMRSFQNSIPLAKSLLNATRPVHVRMPNGVGLPPLRYGFDVDLNRIKRVVRKIVRGLHFARQRRPLFYHVNIEVLLDLTDQQFDSFSSDLAEP